MERTSNPQNQTAKLLKDSFFWWSASWSMYWAQGWRGGEVSSGGA